VADEHVLANLTAAQRREIKRLLDVAAPAAPLTGRPDR